MIEFIINKCTKKFLPQVKHEIFLEEKVKICTREALTMNPNEDTKNSSTQINDF